MISTTPILTTTLKITTTVQTTTLVITTIPTTTLVITTIPTTTLYPPTTTLINPFTTPVNSLDVSSTFNYQSTKTMKTQTEETSAILVDIETTTIFTTHLTQTQTTTQGHSTTIQINASSTEGSSTPPLKPTEILYLILGISVAEFALIASGICIIKRSRRQKEPSKQTHRDIQVERSDRSLASQ
ncbi:uncharacterized protein LOC111126094 isoform X2 [Crassostrea virginica]